MKKKLLSLLLAAAMLFSLAIPALAEEATPAVRFEVTEDLTGSVVILHSNDVHGAIDGYAAMAALKAMYEKAGADVFVMDAGDFIQGETTVSASQGATAVELMNMVGYDVAAPGNHEFDYGFENLKKLAQQAQFPILAANVTYEGEPAFGDRILLKTSVTTGTTIGVFGLDTPETASKAHPAKIAGVKFAGGEELYQAAQAQVNALKGSGADYIVCLGHLGIDEETAATANRSIDLLAKVTGIDVLIDGHSHSTLEELAETIGSADRKVNGTVVTSTGTKFANIGVVVIRKDGSIASQSVPTEYIPVPEDDKVAVRAAEIKAEIEAAYGASFAKTDVLLEGAKAPGVRTQETNLGDLIADAMLWYATKDGELEVKAENIVAVTNGGGIRATIQAGDITRKDINTVLPFGNTVAVVYVTGEKLLETLEASTFCTPEAVGAFPQVAGIRFSIDTTAAYDQGGQYGDTTYYAPKSINRVSIESVNGKDFDPKATYGVVTNDFLAAGGDTYYALATSGKVVDTGTPLDEAVMEYITTQLDGKVTAQTYGQSAGRITVKYAGVEPGSWYTAAAKDVMDKGLMSSTGNGFDPTATVTRATVFQTLYNLAGKPEVEAPTEHLLEMNESVSGISGGWWTNAARWAYKEGLTNASRFEGDRAITRQELVTILYRYDKSENKDKAEVNILTYDDAELVQAWAVDAFQWAVETKVVSGKEGNRLAPTDTATRAELAQILSNYTKDFFPQAAQ